MIQSIVITKEKITVLDQTKLPAEECYRDIINYKDMVEAIKRLRIRGAPAIGIAGLAGVWLAFKEFRRNPNCKELLLDAITVLENSRPTAVNLSYATKLARVYVESKNFSVDTDELFNMVINLRDEENSYCNLMGSNGVKEIFKGQKELRILTHCNTGSLATFGIGTALGVVRELAKVTKVKVWADETRPLMQGSRLTMWELIKSGIEATLIADSMAAHTIKTNKIDLIIVGADRIARNGDSANKIGSYGLSILAKHFNIPFYIVAPTTTIDREIASGSEINIEERVAKELRFVGEKQTAPLESNVFNPAFDVVEGEFITAIITDKGVFHKPYSM